MKEVHYHPNPDRLAVATTFDYDREREEIEAEWERRLDVEATEMEDIARATTRDYLDNSKPF